MCRLTSILGAEHIEGKQHGVGEGGGLLLTGKVESIHLPGITPLVKCRRGLIILQPLYNRVVNDDLKKELKGENSDRESGYITQFRVLATCFIISLLM